MKRFTIVSKNDDLSNQIRHKIHDALAKMDFMWFIGISEKKYEHLVLTTK